MPAPPIRAMITRKTIVPTVDRHTNTATTFGHRRCWTSRVYSNIYACELTRFSVKEIGDTTRNG